MPLRRIFIPSPIQLLHPDTDEPLTGEQNQITFKDFMRRVFRHPDWNKSYQHGRAMAAVKRTIWKAIDAEQPHADVAEADWQLLKACACDAPAQLNPGGQREDGLGYISSVADQIVPFQQAIDDAKEPSGALSNGKPKSKPKKADKTDETEADPLSPPE